MERYKYLHSTTAGGMKKNKMGGIAIILLTSYRRLVFYNVYIKYQSSLCRYDAQNEIPTPSPKKIFFVYIYLCINEGYNILRLKRNKNVETKFDAFFLYIITIDI